MKSLQVLFLLILFTMYWFQVYSLVVRRSYTLQSVPLDISSTLTGTIRRYHNIADYMSYALLSHDYLVTTDLCFSVPSSLSPSAPTPPPHGSHQFWVCSSFVCLFCSLDSIHKWDHMVFVFLCWFISLSIIPFRSIHAIANGKISFFFTAE